MIISDYSVQQILNNLIGCTIIDACSNEEGYFGFIVEDKHGRQQTVIINSDAEGNEPGWIDIYNSLPDGMTLQKQG